MLKFFAHTNPIKRPLSIYSESNSIHFRAGLSNAIFQKAASFRKTPPQSGVDAGLLSALHIFRTSKWQPQAKLGDGLMPPPTTSQA